ncbi:MAG: hypothetical protein ACKN9W_15880 [Methylococcus sp.]
MPGDRHAGGKGPVDDRLLQDLFGAAVGDDPAFMQNDDTVGVLRGQVEVMQNRADAASLPPNEFAGGGQRRLLMAQIQARRGLVEQQERLPDLVAV